MNLNEVKLIGRIAADPVLGENNHGRLTVSFGLLTERRRSVAVKRHRRNIDRFAVVAYGRLARVIGEYVRKGDQLYLEGKLQQQGSRERSAVRIVAVNVIMLGSGPARPERKKAA